jgi:hypothetical protein
VSGQKYDWWVFSTAVRDGVLMLECRLTGSFGIVRDPSRQEWSDAYHAPSKPYRWEGSNERVETIREGPAPKGHHQYLKPL